MIEKFKNQLKKFNITYTDIKYDYSKNNDIFWVVIDNLHREKCEKYPEIYFKKLHLNMIASSIRKNDKNIKFIEFWEKIVSRIIQAKAKNRINEFESAKNSVDNLILNGFFEGEIDNIEKNQKNIETLLFNIAKNEIHINTPIENIKEWLFNYFPVIKKEYEKAKISLNTGFYHNYPRYRLESFIRHLFPNVFHSGFEFSHTGVRFTYPKIKQGFDEDLWEWKKRIIKELGFETIKDNRGYSKFLVREEDENFSRMKINIEHFSYIYDIQELINFFLNRLVESYALKNPSCQVDFKDFDKDISRTVMRENLEKLINDLGFIFKGKSLRLLESDVFAPIKDLNFKIKTQENGQFWTYGKALKNLVDDLLSRMASAFIEKKLERYKIRISSFMTDLLYDISSNFYSNNQAKKIMLDIKNTIDNNDND